MFDRSMEAGSDHRLAGNLARIRNARGLTQAQLGALTNMGRNTVASIETARIREPGVFHVYALAHALGVTMEELLDRPTLVRRPALSLADAVSELERRRVERVDAAPTRVLTPEQFRAVVPESTVHLDELQAAGERAAAEQLARVPGMALAEALARAYRAGVASLEIARRAKLP